MKSYVTFSLAVAFSLAIVVTTASAAVRTVTIRVQGMTCQSCASSIETALKETDGVKEVRVTFEKGEAWIKYDDAKVTVARLREVINSTGFKVVGEKKAAKAATKNDKQDSKSKPTGGTQTMEKNFSTDLKQLRSSFNQDKGKVRLVLLLSPT